MTASGISRLFQALNVSDQSSIQSSARVEGKFTIRLVDNDSSLRELLTDLGATKANLCLALDLEGINLGATGEICVIQLIKSQNPTCIYLVDICTLGKEAFYASLRFDDQVQKLIRHFCTKNTPPQLASDTCLFAH